MAIVADAYDWKPGMRGTGGWGARACRLPVSLLVMATVSALFPLWMCMDFRRCADKSVTYHAVASKTDADLRVKIVCCFVRDGAATSAACRAPAMVNLKRGMAGADGAPKYGAAKSFKEAWLSDKGVSYARNTRRRPSWRPVSSKHFRGS